MQFWLRAGDSLILRSQPVHRAVICPRPLGWGRAPVAMGLVAIASALAGVVGVAGCTAPPSPDSQAAFDDAIRGGDVGAREAWIIRSAAEGESGDDRILLMGLFSDDAGERMLAITALNNKYGDRLGYDYAASATERALPAERWRKKLTPVPRGASEDGLTPGR